MQGWLAERWWRQATPGGASSRQRVAVPSHSPFTAMPLPNALSFPLADDGHLFVSSLYLSATINASTLVQPSMQAVTGDAFRVPSHFCLEQGQSTQGVVFTNHNSLFQAKGSTSLDKFVDITLGDKEKHAARHMMNLALLCVDVTFRRPSMAQIVQELEGIQRDSGSSVRKKPLTKIN
ncbi:Proline-rich receptor-like protein kinase PERK15 [Sesbania bispinosa]|nr:Proline-rich receptor-like protein kinase PERK15 [Sesbania bispinosa]